MTKQDLVDAVASKARISKKQALDAINAMTEAIASALAKKQSVTITGFGTFRVREQKGRERKAFGKTIKTPTKWVPKFKPGKSLRDRVAK